MTEPATSSGVTTTSDSVSNTGEVKYIVLSRDDSDLWAEMKPHVFARSAEAAVKSAAAKRQSGTFVAVPYRSWKPVKVTAKVETTLVVEDAS